ncbi:MAG TPA: histidinol-phosphate transaminase [Thermoanaerobaculia bacterium]|nr:histidinol-phosphate transaminase [Thermoanaerobaculia bacterium]
METTAHTLSRRGFARLLGAGVAAAALRPSLALETATLTTSGEVRIDSNENALGPSPAALTAMQGAMARSWRYPDVEVSALTDALAAHLGTGADRILLGPGSNEVLRLATMASTGSGKTLVMADPTFEAVAGYARASGAPVTKVPLTSDYRHDLAKMAAAASGSGLIYICNPNNPTASLTPKGEIRAFLAELRGRATVLIDEAYHHYVESPDYESAIPLIDEHPNLIVARTFSKIYALAGLRCGYAVARPEMIERLRLYRAWDTLNLLALVAARASLGDAGHVERSRRLNRETRSATVAGLEAIGFRTIPSHANFLMVDLRRESRPVIEALRGRNVYVGRVFPALPSHLRVTVGTREEMEGFLKAFGQVVT